MTAATIHPPLAALPPLSENPHRGFEPSKQTLHQALPFANPLHASGLSTCYYDFRVGPRCTGKERGDPGSENSLDYFGARYYSGAQGRFTSPDPDNNDARLGEPQSWNMYGYTWNNPLKYVDSDGRAVNLALAAGGAAVGGVLGFGGSAIAQYTQNGSVDWGTAGAYGAGGALSGATAGFTCGGSLVFQAVAAGTVATAGNVAGGMASRSLAGEDALDSDAITSDVENGVIGGALGGSVHFLGTVVNLPVTPKVPTPLANVRKSLRRMAKLRAWQQEREQLSRRFSAVGSAMGTVYTNFVTQVKSGWDNSRSYMALTWFELVSLPQKQNRNKSTICYDGEPGCVVYPQTRP